MFSNCSVFISTFTFLIILHLCSPIVIENDIETLWEVAEHSQKKFEFHGRGTEALRLSLSVDPHDILQEFPVFILVRLPKRMYVFQLPLVMEDKFTFWDMSRTLCPTETIENDDNSSSLVIAINATSSISVEISTRVPQHYLNATGSIRISVLQDFHLKLRDIRNITLRPTAPQYFLFNFPENSSSVDIRMESLQSSCLMVSVQGSKCPVYIDEAQNVDLSAKYQSVSHKGHIVVPRNHFKKPSFYVVLMLKADDSVCGNNGTDVYSPNDARSKVVQIQLKETFSGGEYAIPMLLTVSFFAAFYIPFLVLIVVDWRYHRKQWMKRTDTVEMNSHNGDGVAIMTSTAQLTTSHPMETTLRIPSILVEDSPAVLTGHEEGTQTSTEKCNDEFSPQDDNDANDMVDGRRRRRSVNIQVEERPVDHLVERQNMYRRFILIIGLFFALPVIQLSVSYQQKFATDQDFCFYNFYCLRPLLGLMAFNNIFSNVCYFLLGCLFILATLRKSLSYQRKCALYARDNPNPSGIIPQPVNGFPEHFGLFYALGMAMVIQGVMSCFYHVCPSTLNFQFDTAFMYMMSILAMLRIYHNRHPVNNATAHLTFTLLGLGILLGVVGAFEFGKKWSSIVVLVFRISFFFVSLYVTVDIYYRGQWTFPNRTSIARLWADLQDEGLWWFFPYSVRTFILLVLVNCANWGLILFFEHNNFFKFLLALICMDLFLYFCYYVGMKFYACFLVSESKYTREKVSPECIVYFVLAVGSWVVAIWFYNLRSYTWKMTPALSRNSNMECFMLNFYDVHDLWHFMSSLALFFSFMVLLHIDDDLANIPRTRIAVF